MKYYLIKANDMKKTEFIGEYYFDLQKEPIELTKYELEFLLQCPNTVDLYNEYWIKERSNIVKNIRKVLDNE